MTDILKEEEILNQAFIAPQREFKGEKLAPYTEGSRLLFSQIRDDGDSPMYFAWAFLYLHLMINKNKKETINLLWNKEKFRESLFDWVSTKTEKDRELANDIVVEMINESNQGAVEPILSGGQGGNS